MSQIQNMQVPSSLAELREKKKQQKHDEMLKAREEALKSTREGVPQVTIQTVQESQETTIETLLSKIR